MSDIHGVDHNRITIIRCSAQPHCHHNFSQITIIKPLNPNYFSDSHKKSSDRTAPAFVYKTHPCGASDHSEASLFIASFRLDVTQRKTQHKHHIYAGGKVVAIQVKTTQAGQRIPDQTRYLHHDSLGNVDTITNSSAEVIQRIAFKPLGEREVTYSREGTDAWTHRGFTGHEHLQELGLIHMNARLYDPETARFLSPDIYIQAPTMSQNYNRYVYVMNNPLKYTDPSGHFLKKVFKEIGRFFKRVSKFIRKNIVAVVGIAVAFAVPVAGAAWYVGMVKGAAAGFAAGLVGTGSIEGAFKGAFWGGLTGAVAGFVGHGFGGGRTLSPFGRLKGLAHGISQGIITELRGGQFKSGFFGAIIGGIAGTASQVMTAGIRGFTAGLVMARTAVAAVFGGLAAKAMGGSFSDGAFAAAMRHLFNDEAWKNSRTSRSTSIREGSKGNPFSVSKSTRSPTITEFARAAPLTAIFQRVTKLFFIGINPQSLRPSPHPFGVFLASISPKDMGRGTLACYNLEISPIIYENQSSVYEYPYPPVKNYLATVNLF